MTENRTETPIELFRTLPFEYLCEDTTFMPYLESRLCTNDSINNFMFNRMADAHKKMSVSELEHLVSDKMNNISCLPKYFIRCAAYDAKAQYDSYEFIYDYKENNREEIIKSLDAAFNEGKMKHNEYHHEVAQAKKPVHIHFGTNVLFHNRIRGSISHEEFIEERHRPLNSIGEAN